MEIIVLIDNVVYGSGLAGEHGLSFLIKTKDIKILFDTGQTGLFVKNSKTLKEELSDVDYVVLSHGHYDHTHGLTDFLNINKKAKILIKKEGIDSKYSDSKGEMREIGFKLNKINSSYPNEVIFLKDNYSLSEKVTIACNIESHTDFEDDEQHLFIKKNKEYIKDPFNDELFLLIKNNDKINVIAGCAHRGIINIVKTAINLSGNKDINLVIGGTHLKGKSEERFIKTGNAFKNMSIDKIATGHCTGIEGYMKLKNLIGDKVVYASTGMRFDL